jgi:hypothetical protein
MHKYSLYRSSILAFLFTGFIIFSPLALAERSSAQSDHMEPLTEKALTDTKTDHQRNSVSIAKDRIVGADEVITDDVVVVGANLTVNGKVYGDAVCIGGNLTVGPRAEIKGDMVNIGGQLSVDPSAKTNGERVNVGGLPFLKKLPGISMPPQTGMDASSPAEKPGSLFKFLRLILDCIYVSALLFFALILTVFMPRQLNTVEDRLSNEFPRCTLLGIALLVGFPIILFVFIITIVGILAIPVLVLAWALSCLVGYIAFARILGRKFFTKEPVMLQILTGLLVLSSPLLIGDLVLLLNGDFIGHALRVIGFIIVISINIIGFGAVVYSILSRKQSTTPKVDKHSEFPGFSENGNGI